jgi:hypothetical protein
VSSRTQSHPHDYKVQMGVEKDGSRLAPPGTVMYEVIVVTKCASCVGICACRCVFFCCDVVLVSVVTVFGGCAKLFKFLSATACFLSRSSSEDACEHIMPAMATLRARRYVLSYHTRIVHGSTTEARCPCTPTDRCEVSCAEAAATDRAPHRRLQLNCDPALRRR